MPEDETPVKKSQAIRDFLAEYPDASSKTVAEALTAKAFRSHRTSCPPCGNR